MTTAHLILSVLGEAANAGNSLSKTKLLKLLYLVDLETYRALRKTATGWTWKFLHFGPWAAEYDKALDALAAESRITTTILPGDRDTQIIRPNQRDVDVSTLDESAVRMAARRVLNRWLPVDLPALLDYVYFETEPMHSAERGSFLRFDTVDSKVLPPYTRQPSTGGPKKIQELRRKLGMFGERPRPPERRAALTGHFTPPKYDEAALELLRTLEED